jgi:hypothetical protein
MYSSRFLNHVHCPYTVKLIDWDKFNNTQQLDLIAYLSLLQISWGGDGCNEAYLTLGTL